MSRRTVSPIQATAILTADWHIRPDVPVCRTDDYFAAMERKIDFVLSLAKENDCPILIAGDLGDKPLNNGWPTWLLEWTISKFQGHKIIVIPGQHDLPEHRLDQWSRAGIGVLHAAGAIQVIGTGAIINDLFTIFPFPYGNPIKSYDIQSMYKLPWIAMSHQMTIENKDLWPDQNATTGHQLLKQFPEYSLVLTGDNHQPFIAEYQGRILVNPGSLMRNNGLQIDHKPQVYLWYAQSNKVVPVYLPIEQGVVSREHIDMTDAKNERFNSLIARVKEDVEIKLSFEENISNYLKKYRTEKAVVDKTWGAVR